MYSRLLDWLSGRKPVLQTVRLGDIQVVRLLNHTERRRMERWLMQSGTLKGRFLEAGEVKALTPGGADIVLVALGDGEFQIRSGVDKVEALLRMLGPDGYVEALVYLP